MGEGGASPATMNKQEEKSDWDNEDLEVLESDPEFDLRKEIEQNSVSLV